MMLQRNRLPIFLLAFTLSGMAVIVSPVVHAATITVRNDDQPNQGFNDPTPATPVGGNPGTTIGQQRLIAFQFAAGIWASRLTSNVPIIAAASFQPLECTTTEFTLAQYGAINIYANFLNAPRRDTFYVGALTNSLTGTDENPNREDMGGRFNSILGTPGCVPNGGWYYGLDGNAPNNRTDFVSTALHELAHGLGFITQVNLFTGAKPQPENFNDAYMVYLVQLGAVPSDYPSMTNMQRVTASTSGSLFWQSPNVTLRSPNILTAGQFNGLVQMFAPNPAQEGSSVSHWDPGLTPDQMMEPRYTVVIRNPVLEMPTFRDIGWTVPVTSRNAHDFNGDGWSDVLWRNATSGQVLAWTVECTQRFLPPFDQNTCQQLGASSPWVSPTNDWQIVGQRDFNGDGRDDILWRSTAGQILVWLIDRDPQNPNDRTRLVQKGVGSTPPPWPTRAWSVVGTGDFNGDGFGDILWRNTETGQVVIQMLRCRGTGQDVSCPIIGGGTPPTVTLDWEIMGVGDFNGDGFADILWLNTQTGQPQIWLLSCTADGGGSCRQLDGGAPTPPPRDWQIVGTGDFNGDGRTDILWFNNTTRQALVWLITRDGKSFFFSASPALTPPPPWQVQETGDFNGDGKSDILWYGSNGGVAVWLMNGATITAALGVGSLPTDWQIQSANAD